MKKAVSSAQAPQAIGPYSPAVAAGQWLFVSGQIGLDPAGRMVSGQIQEQTRRCLLNIEALLKASGLELSDVVKTTVYLTDLGLFARMNEAYGGFFKPPYPARATVQVSALPKSALVEIEAVAFKP